MKIGFLTPLSLCFCILLITSLGSAKAANEGIEVFYFDFRAGSDVYEVNFRENKNEFQRLSACLDEVGYISDNWHILMEVAVSEEDERAKHILNQQLFRAAVMRSQLKSGLDIPYDKVAFYIRRETSFPNSVRVTLFNRPMPPYTNRDIFFSLSSLPADITRALSRYGELPFYEDEYLAEATYPAETEPVAIPLQPQTEEVPVLQVEEAVAHASTPAAKAAKPAPAAPVAKPAAAAKKPAALATAKRLPPGAYPLNIGVKTNLLPWMGVVPTWGLGGENSGNYSTGAPMYNAALEYYFADRYSLEASFLYAYASYGGKKNNLWGISVFAIEPRFWINPDNSFRKFHVGMRAEYGDFDIKDNKPNNYGKTGRFYSVAFAAGYTLPIYRNFLVEANLTLGYRNMYDGKSYRYDPAEQKNYYEKGFTEGTFVIGLSVALLYRLGFW